MRKAFERSAPHARIVAWFALTSLVVFVLIGVVITGLRARDVRAREERAAASRAELVANEAIGPALTTSDLSGPIIGTRYDAIEQQVRTVLLADPGILRIKIWGTDGSVLFSNDRAEVGMHPALEDDLRNALSGELESDVSDLTAPENVGERKLGSRLFETYVPFRFGMGGPVVGVVEVYQDYSVIQAEIDRLTRTLSISLAFGLLALYAVLLPLMVGVTRTLRRQNQQLSEQADQLSELLEHEQSTVAELRELDRLKSDFVAATSHELRTPLTSIRGYVHILRNSDLASDPVVTEALAAIERQSGRLFRLIANVLRESNLEHGETANEVFRFGFGDLVREVIADFHDASGRIVDATPDDLPPVAGDRRRIQDVLVNLIDNAVKYSSAPKPVVIGASVDDTRLIFWVHDEGIGIAAEELPRIFERFYQVDQSATRSYGGVGLGLHIVGGLLEAVGGSVEIDTQPDVGSTFTVSIPLAVFQEEPTPKALDGVGA
ncbi:MAG: sensor histidine kinase [Actinomycetota bacterium]